MTQRSGMIVPAVLATLFVVPAVAVQDGSAVSLEESLRRTVVALEALAGLGERIESGERGAVEELLQSTEPALVEEQAPGQGIARLRGEVAALEIELDGLHAAMPGALPGHTGMRPPAEGVALIPPTTGLDDAARRRLGAGATLAETPTYGPAGTQPTEAAAEPRPGTTTKRSFEEPGYSADALRLAQAYYRKGNWEDAFALLDGRAASPEEAYWRARCLDKLGRFPEAVAAYEGLVADPDGGTHAQRAREDLEFLRWRRQFEARREAARGKDVR